ncbi:MAG: DUF3313 domain-containing protein, partial [Haliea sp.]|nr:DUF3313 domain-containing protein [Haliea sp.]
RKEYFMHKRRLLLIAACFAATLSACSTTPEVDKQPIPESGFLPSYADLVPVPTAIPDVRIWRYRKPGITPETYTAVILDPVNVNQGATEAVSQDVLLQVKESLQASMVDAVRSKGSIAIVDQPGPNVARISVAITGAEASADSLKPWNFTPVGLAMNAAAYVGDVNSKTPAMLVESKLTDSQTGNLIGAGLVTIQGDSFRTNSGSVESFIAMAKKVVQAALGSSVTAKPS